MKYPLEKISDPENTFKKIFGNYEIHTRKKSKSTKYPQEKLSDQQNTLKKTFCNYEIPT